MIYLLRIYILTGYLFFTGFACIVNAQSQHGRTAFTIHDNWKFSPKGIAYAETVQANDSDWELVSLPHTWNAKDPFDDDRTYRRGISWYRKQLELDQRFFDKKVFLYFEGANQVTHVYVNGHFAGLHKGGYTGFALDITNYLSWKENSSINTIAVQVNNAHDPFIPPLNVGYASYGGIYRDAWVITTDKLHFKDINNNSAGVYISTPSVSNERATVSVKTTVQNESNSQQTFQFVNTLTDKAGIVISTLSQSYTLNAGEQRELKLYSDAIRNPQLWSPDNPYLYKINSRLIVEGKVVDEVNNPLGFRWFNFDANNGFSLNGKKIVLRGTNRHQDMKGKGDALNFDDHKRDLQLIKDMGCNFLRLAHYPQTAEVLNLADQLGLLIWEEVPVVNFITNSDEFLHNTQAMIREMITQGYNHPSVILWGSANEILLHGPDGERIGRHNDSAYLQLARVYSTKLDSTVRAEDSTRYSTLAMHISGDYSKVGIDNIAQVAGYNIYSGWYSGKVEDFGNDLDRRKRDGHVVFVSEYGAEGEIRLNTEKPVRFDYTTQYQRYYHENYVRQINQRPWLAGTAIWNQFDFSQPNIGGPAPHMNQKGMATWDRKPKDVYYFYKANWNLEPIVYIATRDWLNRAGEQGVASTIDVYANISEITLFVNGSSQKAKKINNEKRATWQVPLKEGKNIITASGKRNGKTYSDHVVVEYIPYEIDISKHGSSFKSIAINVGSNAQYLDPSGTIWIEDRAWQKGSFGYLSGRPRMLDRKVVIKNTDDEPMFYTCIDSLSGYRFDVADGQYAITLCFAEPDNLNKGDRVFTIRINDEVVSPPIDLAGDYGFAVAVKKTFLVNAKNGNGVTILFDVITGGAVLNGIKINKQ